MNLNREKLKEKVIGRPENFETGVLYGAFAEIFDKGYDAGVESHKNSIGLTQKFIDEHKENVELPEGHIDVIRVDDIPVILQRSEERANVQRDKANQEEDDD